MIVMILIFINSQVNVQCTLINAMLVTIDHVNVRVKLIIIYLIE